MPLSDLKISTPAGPIACDVPFQPFGPQPVCGAHLTVESPEFLTPDWNAVAILIDWAQPQGCLDFAAYYAAYNTQLAQVVFSDGAFRVQASMQTFSGWELMDMSDSRLFQPAAHQEEWVSLFVLRPSQASGPSDARLRGRRKAGGCIRLALNSPAEAFGHALYAQVLQAVMAASAHAGQAGAVTLPNPPFAPLARRLRVGIRLVSMEHNASQTAP